MFTTFAKLTTALPVALLIMGATPFSTQTAHADPAWKQTRTVEMRFAYQRSAPAPEIYASLQRTAKKACRSVGKTSVAARFIEQECSAELVAKAVQKIQRTDLAAVHGTRTAG